MFLGKVFLFFTFLLSSHFLKRSFWFPVFSVFRIIVIFASCAIARRKGEKIASGDLHKKILSQVVEKEEDDEDDVVEGEETNGGYEMIPISTSSIQLEPSEPSKQKALFWQRVCVGMVFCSVVITGVITALVVSLSGSSSVILGLVSGIVLSSYSAIG